ncbi:MAG TPA: D-hexose-6-phosphate mutarotase [Hyphomicrobiaceae bacterium]|nr:D-hexose-6-phosphate mutarotase [Hyphomicrobiaceae bacterium]
MHEVSELEERFGRAGAVRFSISPLGGPIVTLSAAESEVDIALKGAQVLSWRRGGREMLWLSPAGRLDSAKPLRGGIPVCWPWFGPHPDDNMKPAHGFVRTAAWRPAASSAGPTQAQISLVIATGAGEAGLWPHAARATLTVTLSEQLSLDLATTNRGTAPLPLTAALHTYFAVGEIAESSIEGLSGHDYMDKLDGDRVKSQAGRIIIDREVDRIYLGPAPKIELSDRRLGRRIIVAGRGSASTVVWNPWIDKAARLGDLGPDGWRRMLCIETANAGPDRRMVAPGESTMLGVTYSVIDALR